MSADVEEITDESFEQEVINSDLPVVLDLWAPWCGPCKMVSPVLESLAEENAGKVKVCKLNVDGNVETAARFGISGIPTVLFFKDGEEVKRLIGVQPKATYQETVNQLIGS
ncbi:MAG: thioredoxin [Candidatus Brocadiaceae bacterium]|jgi:thioredoxin 1